jgi:hypothetical protein
MSKNTQVKRKSNVQHIWTAPNGVEVNLKAAEISELLYHVRMLQDAIKLYYAVEYVCPQIEARIEQLKLDVETLVDELNTRPL